MNILELKGEVHEMLVEVRTEKSILKIRQVVQQVIEEEDSEFSFSNEQLEQLKLSIAESRMPENRIPYEDIKKEFAQWFKK
jgi:hypothetical protein